MRSNNPATITLASRKDIISIAKITRIVFDSTYINQETNQACFSEHDLELICRDVMATYPDHIDDERCKIYVAYRQRKVIGYAKIDLKDNCAFLDRIYVLPSEQKSGVGSLLLKACFEQSLTFEQNILRLNVWENNTPAIRYYLNNQFIKTENVHEKINHDGTRFHGIEMLCNDVKRALNELKKHLERHTNLFQTLPNEIIRQLADSNLGSYLVLSRLSINHHDTLSSIWLQRLHRDFTQHPNEIELKKRGAVGLYHFLSKEIGLNNSHSGEIEKYTNESVEKLTVKLLLAIKNNAEKIAASLIQIIPMNLLLTDEYFEKMINNILILPHPSNERFISILLDKIVALTDTLQTTYISKACTMMLNIIKSNHNVTEGVIKGIRAIFYKDIQIKTLCSDDDYYMKFEAISNPPGKVSASYLLYLCNQLSNYNDLVYKEIVTSFLSYNPHNLTIQIDFIASFICHIASLDLSNKQEIISKLFEIAQDKQIIDEVLKRIIISGVILEKFDETCLSAADEWCFSEKAKQFDNITFYSGDLAWSEALENILFDYMKNHEHEHINSLLLFYKNNSYMESALSSLILKALQEKNYAAIKILVGLLPIHSFESVLHLFLREYPKSSNNELDKTLITQIVPTSHKITPFLQVVCAHDIEYKQNFFKLIAPSIDIKYLTELLMVSFNRRKIREYLLDLFQDGVKSEIIKLFIYSYININLNSDDLAELEAEIPRIFNSMSDSSKLTRIYTVMDKFINTTRDFLSERELKQFDKLFSKLLDIPSSHLILMASFALYNNISVEKLGVAVRALNLLAREQISIYHSALLLSVFCRNELKAYLLLSLPKAINLSALNNIRYTENSLDMSKGDIEFLSMPSSRDLLSKSPSHHLAPSISFWNKNIQSNHELNIQTAFTTTCETYINDYILVKNDFENTAKLVIKSINEIFTKIENDSDISIHDFKMVAIKIILLALKQYLTANKSKNFLSKLDHFISKYPDHFSDLNELNTCYKKYIEFVSYKIGQSVVEQDHDYISKAITNYLLTCEFKQNQTHIAKSYLAANKAAKTNY